MDLEIDKLVDSLRNIKIRIATINTLYMHLRISKLLNNLVNYAYLVLRVTLKSISTKRNNKSFISSALVTIFSNKKTR